MTNRERDLLKLDLNKIGSDGRYVDFENDIILNLTYEDILFLRSFYADKNIANRFEFSSVKPIDSSRINPQTQKHNAPQPKKKSVPTEKKDYVLSREQKYTNQNHKGIKLDGKKLLIKLGVIIISLTLLQSFAKTVKNPITIQKTPEGYYQGVDLSGEKNFASSEPRTDEIVETTDFDTVETPMQENEKREMINTLCNIYHLNADKVYEIISQITNDFTSESYLNDLTIENVSCKGSGQLYCSSEEELLLYTVRTLKQAPERFGYSYEELQDTPDFESSTNYPEIIAHYSEVLGVDPCLIHGIIQAETGFDSQQWHEINNPAGLKNNGEWWVFDTKEEGIIELILEVLKYNRMGAYSIEEISRIHCPLSDPDDTNKVNQYWVGNVTEISESVREIYNSMQSENASIAF